MLENCQKSAELLKSVGSVAAQLDEVMKEFSHPGYESQTSLWVLPSVPKLRDFLFALDDEGEVKLVMEIIGAFEKEVVPILNALEKGIIHGDLNENNLIVSTDGKSVEAIIDFGDSHKTCYIFELAVCLCYMITQSNSIEMAKYVIEGYQRNRKMTEQEKQIVKLCVCARLVQSLVLGTYSYKREPENHYLVRAHATKWQILKKLWATPDDVVMELWNLNDSSKTRF